MAFGTQLVYPLTITFPLLHGAAFRSQRAHHTQPPGCPTLETCRRAFTMPILSRNAERFIMSFPPAKAGGGDTMDASTIVSAFLLSCVPPISPDAVGHQQRQNHQTSLRSSRTISTALRTSGLAAHYMPMPMAACRTTNPLRLDGIKSVSIHP